MGKVKGITRDIARAFIANDLSVFATQYPEVVEFFTGVPVEDIFNIAGFTRDEGGVYHARPEAWQQIGGYNDSYDVIFDYSTSMDTDKFEFSSGERDYIFWAWKGDYLNLGAGAELGIYSKESSLLGLVDVTSPISEHWLVDISLAMPMTMSLNYNGKEIANYSEEHWWITSFNPYHQNVNANDLSVKYTIDFKGNETMYDDFIGTRAIKNDSRWSFDNYKATLKF